MSNYHPCQITTDQLDEEQVMLQTESSTLSWFYCCSSVFEVWLANRLL